MIENLKSTFNYEESDDTVDEELINEKMLDDWVYSKQREKIIGKNKFFIEEFGIVSANAELL